MKTFNARLKSGIILQVALGGSYNLELEVVMSRFCLPELEVYFCDQLAKLYQPIVNGNKFSFPSPEGIYYRIIHNNLTQEYCIQYFLYWLDQNCLGMMPIADHKYDYEPILIFFKPPNLFPIGVVNAGYSKYLGISCRFHKTEIRRIEYTLRDEHERDFQYLTSSSPYYPFGGASGRTCKTCIKKYPLSGAIYFEETRPLFALAACSHVFSGAEASLDGDRLQVDLKRLTDVVAEDWYEHFGPNEEPFGHDISDPFSFPYIRYYNPK